MRKYGKLTGKEIRKQFDVMVESAKKEVDKGKNAYDFAFAISNEAEEMARENMVHLVCIHLVAKRCIDEIIEYAAKKN